MSRTDPDPAELPAPPPGRQGWPWTVESRARAPRMPGGKPWPKVTVVTPSFNQAAFIEETIRSVLLQGYPALEYVVIDGGSTDGSVETISRYDPWITHWVSEPDRGQTHAVNKGLERASGEIFAYLNSDDVLAPEALFRVAERFGADPAASAVYGRCAYVGERRETLYTQQPKVTGFADYLRIWERFDRGDFLTQPEVFCRTAAIRNAGGFREELDSVMDFEMWLRLLGRGGRFVGVDATLAEFRSYAGQKSSVDPGDELARVVEDYLASPTSPLSDAERFDIGRELPRARSRWLVRAAIAALDGAGYRTAVKLCWRAARVHPPIASTYEFWAVLARPVRGAIPRRWRAALQRRLRDRRAAVSSV